MSSNNVAFVCNCGEEIVVEVQADQENEVVCPKCGQQYRFFGQSVLRWAGDSNESGH